MAAKSELARKLMRTGIPVGVGAFSFGAGSKLQKLIDKRKYERQVKEQEENANKVIGLVEMARQRAQEMKGTKS
jgi:coproporphyrinogen III oxidase-like Fe-S oxidoreductase